MRALGLVLAVLMPAVGLAECREPTGAASSDRSLSDAPYEPTAAPKPCPRPPEPAGLPTTTDGWTAERDPTRMQVARVGTFFVALGALAMVTGGGFAICAKNDTAASTRRFCHDATLPTLVGGAASAAVGLGALGVSAFVLREQDRPGHAGLSAGLQLRLAMDWPR